jgi:predicted dehydrogenase
MMAPVRFGLVGYGFGGHYFHAPLINSAPECELVGVMTNSPQRRGLVAADLPGTATYASLQELVDAGAEAVTITTPADTHTAVTERALRLGLAVVCDKPFATDAEAAQGTVRLAAELGLPLSPYQNRRWDSDFRTVAKLVADGSLGTVTRLESRFERYAPQNGPGTSDAGTLLGFFSHLADQALVLLGPVTSVYAEWRIRESGLDDDVFVALTHDSGARSHLSGGWLQAAPGPRFRVTGTAGTYILLTGDTQEDRLVAGRSPASVGDTWGAEPKDTWGLIYHGVGTRPVPTEPGRWNEFYPAFARAVRDGAHVPVDPNDAVATARVLDAARTSATTGVAVEVKS